MAVYVTDTLPPDARSILGFCELFEKEAEDSTLARCQVLMAWPRLARKDLLAKLKGLRMVQTMSAGADALDFSALPPGARVYTNAGAFTGPVAEHAWGLLLGVAKGVHVRNQRVVPRKLRGGALLVIGAGAIGSEVARLSRSLGMKTVGVSRSFKSPEAFDSRHEAKALPDLIGDADAVVIALPLTSSTKRLVDYGVLSRAKPSVVVVNVGRGDTVSEDGLGRWLRERPESRYCTDVFWVKGGHEVFDTELWELPNFGGTLHISGVPLGDDLSVPKIAAARNVKLFLETGDALNRADPAEYA